MSERVEESGRRPAAACSLASPPLSHAAHLQLPQVVLPLPLQEVHFLEQLLLMVFQLAHGEVRRARLAERCETQKPDGGRRMREGGWRALLTAAHGEGRLTRAQTESKASACSSWTASGAGSSRQQGRAVRRKREVRASAPTPSLDLASPSFLSPLPRSPKKEKKRNDDFHNHTAPPPSLKFTHPTPSSTRTLPLHLPTQSACCFSLSLLTPPLIQSIPPSFTRPAHPSHSTPRVIK